MRDRIRNRTGITDGGISWLWFASCSTSETLVCLVHLLLSVDLNGVGCCWEGFYSFPPLFFVCLFVLTQTKFSLFPQPISLSAGHLISSPKPNVFLHSLLSKLSSSIFIFCWSFVFPFAFTVCLYFFPPSHLSPTV